MLHKIRINFLFGIVWTQICIPRSVFMLHFNNFFKTSIKTWQQARMFQIYKLKHILLFYV
jgi:predicted SPOUT superfamily RNA methylase MTH1